MNLLSSRAILKQELAQAEHETQLALSEIEKGQRMLRRANGWYHEVLRILEEEDKHG